jgi:DNA recombination protein RmuC
MEIGLVAAITLLLLLVVLAIVHMLRPAAAVLDTSPLQARLEAIERNEERVERSIREELSRGRDEAGTLGKALREEVQGSLNSFGSSVREQVAEMSLVQKNQLELFAGQLSALTRGNEESLGHFRQAVEERHDAMRSTIEARLSALTTENGQRMDQIRSEAAATAQSMRTEIAESFKAFNDSLLKSTAEIANMQAGQLTRLAESSDQKLEAMRATVDVGLKTLQEENAKKLEQIRQTVDEQLHGTLEKRLGESFQLVSDRLEQVYKGLGEVQSLAAGVGDLKKVLSNVRVRGTWGEVQLGGLLEQMLSPEQYGQNVATTGTDERVEYAIRLPGADSDSCVWLPVDAKFPQEDYIRLVDASERGDAEAVETCSRQLEARIRMAARDISEKYIAPPATTDFAIMYLPTEGLYAEVLRRPGIVEGLQREFRVAVAGPTTLAAILNSLQMGFRTLAIQKRSSEVWEVLGAVKTEFGKYAWMLEKVHKKLQEASNTVDQGLVRTRAIERKLRNVQELASPEHPEPTIIEDEIEEVEHTVNELVSVS